jgi:hypothetical protein
MGDELIRQLNNRRQAHDERDDWFTGVSALVAECDLTTLAIKVIIPVLDENEVYGEWVTPLVPWVGPDGYGPVFPPAIGSEVVLFSEMNDGETLFYLSRYNEDFGVPNEFGDGARGLKTDTKYRLLADLLIEIISQQQVLVQGANRVDVKAPLVLLLGGESEVVRVEPNKVGFLGAAAIARQTLPGPADSLPSYIALTNAIRMLLINLGFAD